MKVSWLHFWRTAAMMTFLVLSINTNAYAALPPDLLCEQTAEIAVETSRLDASKSGPSGVIYRISRGALLISSSDRPEYVYGNLFEQEPGRFTVGHKVLLFDSRLTSAQMVHVHPVDIRIANFKCRRLQS